MTEVTETPALPALEAEGEEDDLHRMTLLEHLEELRRRLMWSILIMLGGFMACFGFAPQIFEVLALPIKPYVESLVFLNLTDPFVLYVKVALLASIFLTSPFLLYQVWRFVAPGLYRREKRYVVPFIFFGSVFFLSGGLFGYFIAFPFAIKFLIGLGSQFTPMITVDRYLKFLMTILLGLGVMFELPILIFMLSQMGVVTPRFLLRHFRWAVLIIFTVAAIITPTPDVVNLCVVALPTIVLYLLGVGAAALAQRGKRE